MRVFSPASRGDIGVRLYERCQPGLKLTTEFAPKLFEVQNFKIASHKMARKMLAFYVLQFSALLALNFQLYGLIMTYKMFALRNNKVLASYLSSRQSKLRRKRKHILARQLRRKAR